MQPGNCAETRIAPKQFIPPETGEGNLQPPFTGQPGDTPGVEAIDGGLVLVGQKVGEPGAGLVGAQGQGCVLRPEQGRDLCCRLRFIEPLATGVVEADRERVKAGGSQGQ